VTAWARRTELIAADALAQAEVEAIEKGAAERGIDWSPRSGTATLAWTTESTTEVGRIRKRTRAVRTTGVLDGEVLAWAISDDGGMPTAMVVRRSRVDVTDAMAGLGPMLAAKAGEIGADGLTVRGDLGGRDLGSVFLPLGTGPAADRVRAALAEG
jgi:hypothetical protein